MTNDLSMPWCSSDIGVIILNLIYLGMNIAALAAAILPYKGTYGHNNDQHYDKLVVFRYELTHNQCVMFNKAYPLLLTIYCLTIIIKIALILAATSYDDFFCCCWIAVLLAADDLVFL
jgi:hypothetical protein